MKFSAIFTGIAAVMVGFLIASQWPVIKEECNIRIHSDGMWDAIGWDPHEGRPNDCVMPHWGIFHADGTWEPVTP